jgi:hypothetical protein
LAWVANYWNQGLKHAEYRMKVNYDWDKPTCQAIAWDRIEHGETRKPLTALVVPAGSLAAAPVMEARNGNAGQRFEICPSEACDKLGAQFDVERISDAGRMLVGTRFGFQNNTPDVVLNAIVFFDFNPTQTGIEKK